MSRFTNVRELPPYIDGETIYIDDIVDRQNFGAVQLSPVFLLGIGLNYGLSYYTESPLPQWLPISGGDPTDVVGNGVTRSQSEIASIDIVVNRMRWQNGAVNLTSRDYYSEGLIFVCRYQFTSGVVTNILTMRNVQSADINRAPPALASIVSGLLDASNASYDTADTIGGNILAGAERPGVIVAAQSQSNRIGDPIELAMHENTKKTFQLAVADSAGNVVDWTGKTCSFAVFTKNGAASQPFATVTGIAGDADGAPVTVSKANSATAGDGEFAWILLDDADDTVLVSGILRIVPARHE